MTPSADTTILEGTQAQRGAITFRGSRMGRAAAPLKRSRGQGEERERLSRRGRPTTRPRRTSPLEARAELLIRAAGLPAPEREYRFAPPRRWRFDFAWPHRRVALEVDGGAGWAGFRSGHPGRHRSVEGVRQDAEKLNRAAALGWRVIRATPEMLDSSALLADLAQALDIGT